MLTFTGKWSEWSPAFERCGHREPSGSITGPRPPDRGAAPPQGRPGRMPWRARPGGTGETTVPLDARNDIRSMDADGVPRTAGPRGGPGVPRKQRHTASSRYSRGGGALRGLWRRATRPRPAGRCAAGPGRGDLPNRPSGALSRVLANACERRPAAVVGQVVRHGPRLVPGRVLSRGTGRRSKGVLDVGGRPAQFLMPILLKSY